MSRYPLDRRQFLTLPFGLFLAPLLASTAPRLGGAEPETRRTAYGVDVGVLWDAMTFHLPGTLEESVDRTAGRYEIKAVGQGSQIQNRIESRGVLAAGRWAPLEATSWFQVAGRETRYDYDKRRVEYHFKGETFLLRRVRVADDVVTIPPGLHVDDVITAVLNYADGRWPPEADGRSHTLLVLGEGAAARTRALRARSSPRIDRRLAHPGDVAHDPLPRPGVMQP